MRAVFDDPRQAIYELPESMELAAKKLADILRSFGMDATLRNPEESIRHFGNTINDAWSVVAVGGPDCWGDSVSGGVNPFGEYLLPLVPFSTDEWHLETWGGYDVMFFDNVPL